MGFDAAMVSDDSLTSESTGYVLTLRLPWMRSLPWSCVEDVHVSVDGQPVDSTAVEFEVGDDLVPLGQLADRWQDYWVVGRPIRLHLRTGAASTPGRLVQLDLALRLRIPYLILGPAGPLVLPVRASRNLEVQAADLEGTIT